MIDAEGQYTKPMIALGVLFAKTETPLCAKSIPSFPFCAMFLFRVEPQEAAGEEIVANAAGVIALFASITIPAFWTSRNGSDGTFSILFDTSPLNTDQT